MHICMQELQIVPLYLNIVINQIWLIVEIARKEREQLSIF